MVLIMLNRGSISTNHVTFFQPQPYSAQIFFIVTSGKRSTYLIVILISLMKDALCQNRKINQA